MIEYTILAGLLFGLYFSLVGLGLNLVFGVVRIVNLAHGDFLMLGAFSAYWLFSLFSLYPVISALLAFIVFSLVAWPLYYLLVPRLLAAKDPEMLSLVLFFGLSQVIEALTVIAFGTSERSIPGQALGTGPIRVLGQSFPASWTISGIVSGIAVAFVYFYLYHTRRGYLTRAVMASREEAMASGINVNRVSAISFGIGLGLAAVAGVFAPFIFGSVTPSMGVEITVTSFTVIVVGSLGNPLGTVLGGILYGLSLMFMQTYFSSWANLLPYLLLILVLLVRPSGLLGRRVRYA
jgi:branched-chain amino acid transport system permease protein